MIDNRVVGDLLRGLGFSGQVPREMLEELAAVSAVVNFPAGAAMFHEDVENHFLYLVERGRVGLDMHVPGRGRVRILSVGSGDILAWSALLAKGLMTVSAVALEDTQAIAVSGPTLSKCCETNHELGYQVMRRMAEALSHRLIATRLQLLDLFGEPNHPGWKGV
ncbi:MAG TPA: Crp/Fnr family transcriptional regulator [Pirellulales bacterium]|nr:Crp/Fnr family transcriptional regulator [Pirellulales bacterium]